MVDPIYLGSPKYVPTSRSRGSRPLLTPTGESSWRRPRWMSFGVNLSGRGVIQCSRTFPVGIVGTSRRVAAQRSASATHPPPSHHQSPTIIRNRTHHKGAMDSSIEFNNGFQHSSMADVDMLVNAALCARTGTYVFPLTQTICDNG